MPTAARGGAHAGGVVGSMGSRRDASGSSRPAEGGRLRAVVRPGLVAGGMGASSPVSGRGAAPHTQGGREAARADLFRGRVNAV